MGANSTKIDSSEEEEIKLLLPKMFGVSNLKDIGLIDKNKLQVLVVYYNARIYYIFNVKTIWMV